MDDDSCDGRRTPDDTPPSTLMKGPHTPPVSPGSPPISTPSHPHTPHSPHTPLQDDNENYLNEDPLAIGQPLDGHQIEQKQISLLTINAESVTLKSCSLSPGNQSDSQTPNLVSDSQNVSLDLTLQSGPQESDTEHSPEILTKSIPDDSFRTLISSSPEHSTPIFPSSPQPHTPSPSPLTIASPLNGVPDDSLETPPPKKRRKVDGKSRSKEHGKKEAFRHKVRAINHFFKTVLADYSVFVDLKIHVPSVC